MFPVIPLGCASCCISFLPGSCGLTVSLSLKALEVLGKVHTGHSLQKAEAVSTEYAYIFAS